MSDYRNDYNRFESDARWTMGRTLKLIVPLMILLTVSGLIWRSCSYVGRVATVASEELDPRTLLTRYEWFKNAAAGIDKKNADIRVYDVRLKALGDEYKRKTRNEWAREDREQYNLWLTELAGVKASYNSLAAEYNANMSKFNFRFTNMGDLPAGATQPLPREFKPYTTE